MELSYKPTQPIFNERRAKTLIHNKRRILRAVFNGHIIWSSTGTPFYLEIEKENVDLGTHNNFYDENEVTSNTHFTVK